MKDNLDNSKIFQLYIENTIIRESMRPTLGSPGEVSFMIEGILKRVFLPKNVFHYREYSKMPKNEKEYNLTLQTVQRIIALWLERLDYSSNSNIYINDLIMESVKRGRPESNFDNIFPLRLALVDPEKTSAYLLSIPYGGDEGSARQKEISTGDIKEPYIKSADIWIDNNNYKNIYSR